jgi:hypothetical protein
MDRDFKEVLKHEILPKASLFPVPQPRAMMIPNLASSIPPLRDERRRKGGIFRQERGLKVRKGIFQAVGIFCTGPHYRLLEHPEAGACSIYPV